MNRIFKVVSLVIMSFCSLLANAQNQDLETILRKGRQAYDAGNYENSTKWLKQAHKFDKKSDEIICELALSCLANGDYIDAALYSGKVISNKKAVDYVEECYIIHGNAWDKQLRGKRARKIYKEGIEKYPSNYLMYYHLANSYYRDKEYEEAESTLYQVLSLNTEYADAHLLLAYIEYDKGERIKAMLPLYYYLLINQDSDRSEGVYDFLNTLWAQGARVKAQRESKLYKSGVTVGDFVEQEHLLNEYEYSKDTASYNKDTGQNITLLKFADDTKYLFANLSKGGDDKYGFFWEHYASLFAKLAKNGYTEAFSYFVSDCKYNDDVLLWMSSNYQTFKRFTIWMENQ